MPVLPFRETKSTKVERLNREANEEWREVTDSLFAVMNFVARFGVEKLTDQEYRALTRLLVPLLDNLKEIATRLEG